MSELTLAFANALAARGIGAAEASGLKAVFAVLDAGANLVAFARMDGAWLASNELAIAKARTAVMFRAPTEALATPLTLGEPLLHFDHIHPGGLLLAGGGLPLFDDADRFIGGIGVSGGTPDQDGALARAVVDCRSVIDGR